MSNCSGLISNQQFRSLAKKYVWWKTADEVPRYPHHAIAQVMNLGTWIDVRSLETMVAPDLMRTVVERAEPGWFNEDSWHYWHYRLALTRPAEPVPELPRRAQVVPTPEGRVKLSCFGGLGFGRFGEPEIAAGAAVVVASQDDLLATKLAAVMMRIQSKDYRDIAALLRAGVSLEHGLAIAAGMYGAQFATAQCLKTLTYFQGGDLAELAANDRNTLCAAAATVGDLPAVTRLSNVLSIEKG